MLLYKFRSFDQLEFMLDIIVHERLYCTPYKRLNDPFEGTFYTALHRAKYFTAGSAVGQPLVKSKEIKTVDDLFMEASETRVCSLSGSFSDVRLWSFYAGGHTGVAIEIDFNGYERDVYEVNYTESVPEFGSTLLGGFPTSTAAVLTKKTNQWKYEDEYRIICDTEWYSISNRIRRILAGPRASDDRVAILRKITNGLIPIERTKLDFDQGEVKT